LKAKSDELARKKARRGKCGRDTEEKASFEAKSDEKPREKAKSGKSNYSTVVETESE
jgi:hypothetical protein